MRTCPKCGLEIENDKAKFCKKCGTLLPAIPKREEDEPKPVTEPVLYIAPEAKAQDGGMKLSPSSAPTYDTEANQNVLGILGGLDRHKREKIRESNHENKNIIWAVKTCFRKYAVFEGRASRSEYWYFVLFNFLAIFMPVLLAVLINEEVPSSILCIVANIYMVASIIPSLSVSVRRLHDIGKSGAYYFMGFIPFIGGFILLYFFCEAGDNERNKYGEAD